MTEPPPNLARASVGRPARIEGLVLPGTRLEPAADPGHKAAVAVRIVDFSPHGAALRYDLEVTGYEPGRFDVRKFLVRADGSLTADLPEITLEVTSALAAGAPRVSVPERVPVTGLAGYRATAIALAVVWFAGLVALAWLMRRRGAAATAAPQPTPEDRLATLVAQARRGRLAAADHAAIERLVYDVWRRSLGLVDAAPRLLVGRLREDSDAAAALDRLAAWLHAPTPVPPADVATFVEEILPRRKTPAETMP